VTKVHVKVGHLRQIVPSALDCSFGLVAEGTLVEGAELELEEEYAELAARRVAVTGRGRLLPEILER
jgi:Zn finger protein HypA/HybF involved in hydrogenase expression